MNKITTFIRSSFKKLQREVQYLSFLLFSLCIVIAVFGIAKFTFKEQLRDLMKDFWFPAFAAFFGSVTAFGFTFYREEKQETSKKHSELIKLHFTLIAQNQFLFNAYFQYILKLDTNPLQPWVGSDFILSPDIQALSFILQSSKADLLNQIWIGYKNFDCFLTMLQQRNTYCLKIQEETFKDAIPTEENRFSINVSPAEIAFMNNLKDNLTHSWIDAWKENRKTLDQLEEYRKHSYPDFHTLSFVPLNELKEKYEALDRIGREEETSQN